MAHKDSEVGRARDRCTISPYRRIAVSPELRALTSEL